MNTLIKGVSSPKMILPLKGSFNIKRASIAAGDAS